MQLFSRVAKINSAIQFCKFLNAMVLQGVRETKGYPFQIVEYHRRQNVGQFEQPFQDIL